MSVIVAAATNQQDKLCLDPRHPHHASTGGWGKERGALDLESTAEHDILSNGSDHYLQSFVIHVRHAKQGWFSFLVEGIVNPERFLLLFSLSFLITHTHTVGVASPPVSFSVK